jgi:Holliday junction DNA helicase RuvA
MLGFSKSVAEKALDSAIKFGTEDLSVEVLIKTALKSL